MSTQTGLTDLETADLTRRPTSDVVESRAAGDAARAGADHATDTTADPSAGRVGEQNQADGRAHEVGAPAGDVRDELTVDRSGDTAAGLDRPGPDGTALDRTGIDGTALDQTVPVRSGFDGTGLGEITLDGTRLSATGLDRTGPDGAGGGGRRAGLAGCGAGDGDRLARAGLSRVVEPGDLKALKLFDWMATSEVWEMLLRKSRGTER